MRKWLPALVTAITLGILVPVQPAGAALFQSNAWIGNCVGEIDVTLTPKPSLTSLSPSVAVSMQGSGLLCVVATTPPGYSGPVNGTTSGSGGNVTTMTCEAGTSGLVSSFSLDSSKSNFPEPVGITTVLTFNGTAATMVMVNAPNFTFAAAGELVPLDPVGLTNACESPPGGSITIRYEAVMVFEDPMPPSVGG